MDLRNKWFVKQLSTQQFSGGHFTAEKRGHFAVEWWGHLRAELVGHYPRILQYSAIYLEEALLKCCDIKIIEQSIGFIKSLCSKELGFEALTELQKKYREPKFNNPLGKRTRKKGDVDNLNKVHVVKLRILVRSYDINSKDYVTGKAKAEKAIQDWDRHNIEDYKYSIDGRPKIGDVVIRIINNKGKVSVSAPATILNIQPIAKTKQSFVFVEAPNKKDKSLKTVNAFLKSDELTRAGQKGHDLAAKLNSLWT